MYPFQQGHPESENSPNSINDINHNIMDKSMTIQSSMDYASFLADLKSKRAALDKAINQFESLAELGLLSSSNQLSLNLPDSLAPISVDFNRVTVYDGAVILLKEKGTSMKTHEIVEELIKRGKIFESTKPNTSAATTLYKEVKKEGCKIKLVGESEWALKS